MTAVQVRSPASNEFALMRQLYTAMYELLSADSPPNDWIVNVHQQVLKGDRIYWFALLDGSPIGFVDFKIMPFHPGSEQKFATIFDLYIAPDFQRQGHGTAIARMAIQAALEQGASSIELNVLPDNQTALAFWQRIGFTLQLYHLQMTIPPVNQTS